MTDAQEVIHRLGMEPHPEGGWFRETWRAPSAESGRSAATAIYYLLESRQNSHWHRVDADEIWLFHGGDPLILALADNEDSTPQENTLGADMMRGHVPQIRVPQHVWQAAEPMPGGRFGYSLASCIVVPGFDFEGFTLASPGWQPGSGRPAL